MILPNSAVRLLVTTFACLACAWAEPVDISACLPDKQFPYLQELLDHALTQSPDMLKANIDLAQADASIAQAQSLRWPSLGGSSRYETGTVSTTDNPSYNSSGFFYDIGLNYSLFKWGDIRNSIEIEQLRKRIYQKNYAEAYRALATSIRTKFLQLANKKRALEIRRFMFANMKAQFAEAEQKVKNGVISSGDFATAELGLAEAQLGLDREESDYSASKRVLARLTGLAELDESRIPDEIPLPAYAEGMVDRLVTQFSQSMGAETTPTALAYKDSIRQSELRYKIANARLLPKFEFHASSSVQNLTYLTANELKQNATRQQTVGLVASWSIFDGFYSRAAKKSALAEKRATELQRDVYLKSFDDSKEAFATQVVFSARAMAFSEKRLSWAKGGYDFTVAESKTGRMSDGQVTSSKLSLMGTEQQAMIARADLYARWSDLISALWMDPALDRIPYHRTNKASSSK